MNEPEKEEEEEKKDIRGSLEKGIALSLSKWNGLQMAVQNEWGGPDSAQKSQQLASDILSWSLQSKVLNVEDLESMLHETLLLTFNTEIEDGSIEHVAEELMLLLHEHNAHLGEV